MLTHRQLRELFQSFWRHRHHKEIPPIPLVPQNDPTTLFTGSGMQQLVPYLLGETHPLGNKLYNIQPCLRAQDIEEVGDNRHDTFFEMMGNWSLGDYFKKEQLNWFFDFLVDELKLNPKKLYVSVFAGDKQSNLPADIESISIWKDIFRKYGIEAKEGERIFLYGPEKNWWSRAGTPKNMPIGEPGGPDSEVFFEFDSISHDKIFGEKCHPNCDCGRFLEIGNSVFMQYKKAPDGAFLELPKKNVDFGGGLERIIMALENQPDMFKTSLFDPIIRSIESVTGKNYQDNISKPAIRIISDHLKAAVFIASEGIEPTNKDRGYILRRLIRRSVVKMLELKTTPQKLWPRIYDEIISTYKEIYFNNNNHLTSELLIGKEMDSFLKTIDKGTKLLQTTNNINGKLLFDLKQSYGFPIEIAIELLNQWGNKIDKKILISEYQKEFNKHQQLSRTSSGKKFKGGLADQSGQTIKYHTATHLLHQALSDVVGKDIRQEGSNITGERLRFDFYSVKKPNMDEIKKVSQIVNEKVKMSLGVSFKILPKNEAMKLGAKSFFREKYPDMVKVYFIGDYSKEFCGGPHVTNTKEIGKIEIYKFEKIGSNLYRIYAK